jgi:RimJ/RimL family protein N-acetyltransferase
LRILNKEVMSLYLLEGTETARMRLRQVQETDFEAWLPFFQDPSSTAYWEGIPHDPHTACREQFDRIFHRYRQNLGGMNALIHRESGALLGLAGLLVQEVDGLLELEIGYSLLPGARGQGYASEAGRHCRNEAFMRRWADSLISIIHVQNEPSMRVARAMGMQPEKDTEYMQNPVRIFRIRTGDEL